MRKLQFGRLAIALAALATLSAVACGSPRGTGTVTPSAAAAGTRTPLPGATASTTATSPPTATPHTTQTPAPGATPSATVEAGLMIVAAPIDKLELITRESNPPQYAVNVTSGLPDGCTKFHEARTTGRSGTTVTIAVTNTHPSDPMIACTAIYGTHEEVVELGTDFARGTAYVVRVNDKELRFTAQ